MKPLNRRLGRLAGVIAFMVGMLAGGAAVAGIFPARTVGCHSVAASVSGCLKGLDDDLKAAENKIDALERRVKDLETTVTRLQAQRPNG